MLFDWVVTLPKDCPPERSREFFEAVAEFMEERYGKGNVLGCYVHMDEAQPHAHVPILPMIDGKMQASKVINRSDLKSFHGDLGKHVDKALGIHVSIELDEKQKGEKQLSHLSQDEYVAAKKRLERLRCEVEELEPTSQTLGESARTLWTARNDAEREEGLAGKIEGLRSRISALEGEKAGIEGEIRELECDIPDLERRAGGLERSVKSARQRFEELAKGVRGYVANVGERMAVLLSRFGVEAYAGQPPLEVQMKQAQEVVKAMNASRGYVEHEKGIGR